jgi:hypothetical protein
MEKNSQKPEIQEKPGPHRFPDGTHEGDFIKKRNFNSRISCRLSVFMTAIAAEAEKLKSSSKTGRMSITKSILL